MTANERRLELDKLMGHLREIQDNARKAYETQNERTPRLLASLRASLTATERRIAVVRLLQSEDRLLQQLRVAALGFGGAVVGWLLKGFGSRLSGRWVFFWGRGEGSDGRPDCADRKVDRPTP